jgi:hypothetical protein
MQHLLGRRVQLDIIREADAKATKEYTVFNISSRLD